MTLEFVMSAAVWLLAWALVLKRWRGRRIDTDPAALLLAMTSAASLGLYSLLRYELTAVILIVLLVWALVVFAFGRFVLRVFAGDRPQM